MLHSLDPRRGWLLTNSLYTQTSGAELHQIKLAHSMRVHPSDSLSLQPGKSPLQSARSRLASVVRGQIEQTAANIGSHHSLFLTAIFGYLINFIGDVVAA